MKKQGRNFLFNLSAYAITCILVVTFMAMAFSLSGCETKERVIKIGSQAVFSGDDRFYGQDQAISLQIAVSELSPVRVGGYDYKINIVSKDDEGNAEKSFLIAQEYVEENVAAVIGSTFNGTTKAALPVYAEYNIPMVTPSAQGVEIQSGYNNFYRMLINNSQKIENIAIFITETIKHENLILIDNGEDYSIKLVNHLIEIFDSRNITYGKRYSVKFDSDEYSTLAENILIDEPDTIFFCSGYNELASLITNVRKLGVNCTFITEEMGMDEGILALADDTFLEGLLAIIPEPPALAKYSEDKKAVEFWRKYNDYVRDMGDEDMALEGPGQFAPYSYDALYIVIDAIKKSNSILPDDFNDELRATSYDGVAGHIEFNSNGEKVNPPSTVFILKNGDWVRY